MLTTKHITAEELHTTLKDIKVGGVVCHYSLKKCEELVPLINEINELKEEKNAVILVHSYVSPEIVYGVGDYVGDSYALSKNALETNASTIVFSAVRFMGETAKALNPDKDVLLPGVLDGCTLADSITAGCAARLSATCDSGIAAQAQVVDSHVRFVVWVSQHSEGRRVLPGRTNPAATTAHRARALPSRIDEWSAALAVGPERAGVEEIRLRAVCSISIEARCEPRSIGPRAGRWSECASPLPAGGSVMVDGGTLFVRTLRQAGVDTLFCLHGGHLDPIFQAAAKAEMRLVDTRHEQAAGHAADGWARTTGRPGVAIVTAGPGMTDCVTAIANAHLDCVPTLFVAGAAPLREAETLPLQGGLDQVAMVQPITKWAHQVTHTERIPDLVAQALRIATTGRPGPVFLELPIDVLFARVDEAGSPIPEKILPEGAPAPAPEAVEQAIEWLHGAERPAILLGGGAWFSGAEQDIVRFAERTGIPVFSNGKAHGIVPAEHPLCGHGFMTLAAAAGTGAGAADVVLILGARLGLFMGGRGARLIPAGAKLIQVDIAAEEIGRNRRIDLGIAADCREAVRALDRAAATREWKTQGEWASAIAGLKGGHRLMFAEALQRSDAPIHPYRLAHDVMDCLPEDAIVTADGGETASWMDMVARTKGGGSWMSHGYLGCLGTGMPFAIAAQVAHPERRVCCIVGDGSVGLNFSEFDTMVRHGLPIVVVVNNDQLWGMSAHGQDLIYGRDRRVVTELEATRYDLAAAGFGCHAEFVEKPDELRPALERALASGKPACVNVMTDGDVIAPVTRAMVGGGGGGDEPEKSGNKVTLPYYEDLE